MLTEAGNGLGQEISVGLSQLGAKLVLVRRNEDHLRRTQDLV